MMAEFASLNGMILGAEVTWGAVGGRVRDGQH